MTASNMGNVDMPNDVVAVSLLEARPWFVYEPLWRLMADSGY